MICRWRHQTPFASVRVMIQRETRGNTHSWRKFKQTVDPEGICALETGTKQATDPAMHLTAYITLFAILSLHTALSSPIISSNPYTQNTLPGGGRPAKKDPFISRGWGAGGMPFSVLYMSPYSSKAPSPLEEYTLSNRAKEQRQKNMRQARTSVGSGRRKQYSVIPQLFVSYGWGPLGK